MIARPSRQPGILVRPVRTRVVAPVRLVRSFPPAFPNEPANDRHKALGTSNGDCHSHYAAQSDDRPGSEVAVTAFVVARIQYSRPRFRLSGIQPAQADYEIECEQSARRVDLDAFPRRQ